VGGYCFELGGCWAGVYRPDRVGPFFLTYGGPFVQWLVGWLICRLRRFWGFGVFILFAALGGEVGRLYYITLHYMT
jgi:hypothetical protein